MSKKLKFESVKTFYPDLKEFVPEGAELERKNDSMAEIKAVENFGIEAVFSAPTTDREGDIIYPLGCVSDYYNGVIIWNHELSQLPIGRCDDFNVSKDGVTGKIKLASEYAFARDVYGLIRDGILKGVSIGFIPLEAVQRGTRAFSDFVIKAGIAITEATERIITKWEWIETSICPVGCNRDALIYGLASKSLSFEDTKTEKAFGIDESAKEIITLKAQLIEAKTALESIETKAVQTPEVETKAQAEAPKPVNPADLSWQAYVRVLMGQENDLTLSLNAIWNDATETISKIDTRTSDIPEIAAQLDGILTPAADKADALTRAEVEKIADQVFDGFRVGWSGEPIRDIEIVDKLRADWVDQYMAQMQPQPEKPLQFQTIEDFKNQYLRAAQAGEPVPTLDMQESNAATANLSVFGNQQDLVSAIVKAADAGDLVQVRGLDDEKLCNSCRPYLDQFLSVSGTTEGFDSVEKWQSEVHHINCRCTLIPIEKASMEKTFKTVSEKAVAKVLAEQAEKAKALEAQKPSFKAIRIGGPQKPVLTDEMRTKAQALAQGKLVYL